MLQASPYPPRTLNRCRCKRPCIDWKRDGKLLKVWTVGATGPWERLNDALVLTEAENGDQCTWGKFFLLDPDDPTGENLNLTYNRNIVSGTGIPFLEAFELEAKSFDFACTEFFFWLHWETSVTEQLDCRRLPDLLEADATVLLNGGCAPGAYTIGEKLFMRWLAFDEMD